MKVVILAGGLGTRISEESRFKPKPMIEIGGRPILWHIMKTYSHYGFNEFVICAGYKQEVIKDYFSKYFVQNSDITFDYTENQMYVHHPAQEDWKVTVVDTGLSTMTGGRVKRVRDYLDGQRFMLTYGDGVADIDLRALLAFHEKKHSCVTMSSYLYEQRFGVVNTTEDGKVVSFREKTHSDGYLINIGYMVCEPDFLNFIDGDETVLEQNPLQTLAEQGKLYAYRHNGFWQCMDTLGEKQKLEEMIAAKSAPWIKWDK